MKPSERLKNLLFPPKCAVCQELLDYYEPTSRALCDTCLGEWENEALETCGICGKRIGDCECVTEEMRKANCAAFCKLIYYRRSMRKAVQNRLIYHLKDTPDRAATAFCAERLLPLLTRLRERIGVDRERCMIVCIPRGIRARLQTGTDQAEALARELSRLSGIRFARAIMRQWRANTPQKQLSTSARLENARVTFRISPKVSVSGTVVFLVDDIVTTGASMAVCTRILRKAGADTVFCLAVAADDTMRDR